MNRRKTILIIIVISSALVGLMLIQGYWVRNAYRINQANFGRTVHEAAYEVIINLEKQQMAREFEKSQQYMNQAESYREAVDSVNRMMLQKMQSIQTRKDLEVFYNKYFLTRELMEDMIIMPEEVPIEKKVSLQVLDSMINESFAIRNLQTPYVLGVYSTSRNEIVMKTTEASGQILQDPSQSFHFELYPDDLVANPDYLMLHFPNERQYLTGRVWPMIGISIVLVLIIIFSFTYTFLMFNRLRKLSELKTDFINNMTHEFKTPISTISLACEALNDKDIQKSEELYQSYIKIINEENNRLGLMAEQILQTAKMEKGDISLNLENTDIHELLTEVIRNITIQVEIKDGMITSDLKAEDCLLEIDRMHMTNVFLNLLDNANKYSPVKPEIRVETFNQDGWLVCSIEDNGIGISKSDQKKIFEKLYRVPEGNIHNFKGFGLGLNYVKTIVEKHGGHVRLESELRKGTRFEVLLPLNHQKSDRNGK
jgi:two-component system phosphate regulon sensor histidine kinase PhoR